MARSPTGIQVIRHVTPTERRQMLADDRKALAEFRKMSAAERKRQLEGLRRMAQ
jgi:hypothetical protein